MARKTVTTTLDENILRKAKRIAFENEVNMNELIEYLIEGVSEKDIPKIIMDIQEKK